VEEKKKCGVQTADQCSFQRHGAVMYNGWSENLRWAVS